MATVLPLSTDVHGKVIETVLPFDTVDHGKVKKTVLPLDTAKSGKAFTSDLASDTQKTDYNLCSICNFIVPESATKTSGTADVLDGRFIAQYTGVMQEFKDTYHDLDASMLLFGKALQDMDKFGYSVDLSAPDTHEIDAFAYGLRHRTYKSHVRNASRDLTSDITRLRIFLETCFLLQRDILEVCRGCPESPMSKSAENRARGLLDALAKNTYRMREQLSACKCLIQSFDKLNDSVLSTYYVN